MDYISEEDFSKYLYRYFLSVFILISSLIFALITFIIITYHDNINVAQLKECIGLEQKYIPIEHFEEYTEYVYDRKDYYTKSECIMRNKNNASIVAILYDVPKIINSYEEYEQLSYEFFKGYSPISYRYSLDKRLANSVINHDVQTRLELLRLLTNDECEDYYKIMFDIFKTSITLISSYGYKDNTVDYLIHNSETIFFLFCILILIEMTYFTKCDSMVLTGCLYYDVTLYYCWRELI